MVRKDVGMAHALVLFFDDKADARVRSLWRRLESAGVPSLATKSHRKHRPHLSFAVAGTIPASTRKALRADLSLLVVPNLWLYTLGTFPNPENILFLGAVTDAELLAVHSAVHDILAGKVKQPSAAYLPGAWIPHCTLAMGIEPGQLTAGVAALHPIDPIKAAITEIGIVDTQTGEVDTLLHNNS